MARRKHVISEAVWYVPDIDDNRQDPDPFRVLIEPMTGAEADEVDRALGNFTKGQKFNSVDRAVKHRDNTVLNRTRQVAAYLDPETGAEVTTAGELLVAVRKADGNEPDLVLDDIYQAIRDHSKLRDGLLDRLRSQSEST